MRTASKRTIRAVAAVLLVVGVAILANAVITAGTVAPSDATSGPTENGSSTVTAADGLTPTVNESSPTGEPEQTPDAGIGLEERINRSDVSTAPIPEDAEVTVIATQGFYVSDENAELVALTRSGQVVYHDNTYRVYFDVDPVPGTRYTVEYVASEHLTGEDCSQFQSDRCTRNVVERVNLSTGAIEEVWADVTPGVGSTRHHDVDRLNETHLVVADIYEDRVSVVDTRTGETEWTWSADEHYTRDQGGRSGDWTHINDVEILPDGRIMASPRNMDEVIFIEPGEGVNESWTLGEDDNHDILHEQHNPDYIPEDRGGPAVLVGDSENNRVIEYRRVDDTGNATTAADGKWVATWLWRDLRLQWPRDADRLPNDNTLIVDSHGDRVLEVAPDGNVTWSVDVGMPYDAERLGTGDESAGGHTLPRSSKAIGDAGNDAGEKNPTTVPLTTKLALAAKDLLPSLLVNSLLYVAPEGIRFGELVIAFVVLLDGLVWGFLEYRWSNYSVRSTVGRLWDRIKMA